MPFHTVQYVALQCLDMDCTAEEPGFDSQQVERFLSFIQLTNKIRFPPTLEAIEHQKLFLHGINQTGCEDEQSSSPCA